MKIKEKIVLKYVYVWQAFEEFLVVDKKLVDRNDYRYICTNEENTYDLFARNDGNFDLPEFVAVSV